MRTRIFKADKLLLPALTIFVPSLANAPAAPAQSNRTVFVEGNRAGGSTGIDKGRCGDYDHDGLIGADEDNDGFDNVFGTINGALAALGGGNGRVLIVSRGRSPNRSSSRSPRATFRSKPPRASRPTSTPCSPTTPTETSPASRASGRSSRDRRARPSPCVT